jgi:hypothetical protein
MIALHVQNRFSFFRVTIFYRLTSKVHTFAAPSESRQRRRCSTGFPYSYSSVCTRLSPAVLDDPELCVVIDAEPDCEHCVVPSRGLVVNPTVVKLERIQRCVHSDCNPERSFVADGDISRSECPGNFRNPPQFENRPPHSCSR